MMKLKIKWPTKSILYVVLGSILGPFLALGIALGIIQLCGFPIFTQEGIKVIISVLYMMPVLCLIVLALSFAIERERLIINFLSKMLEENTKKIQEQLDLDAYFRTLEEVDGIENLVDN